MIRSLCWPRKKDELYHMQSQGDPCPSTPQSGTAPPTWATTSGGRYKFAPYVAEFADLVLHGCAVDPGDRRRACQASDAELYDAITMSADQRTTMAPFRKKHLSYSYCHDRVRYPAPPPPPPPERVLGPEAESFLASQAKPSSIIVVAGVSIMAGAQQTQSF
ncbi:hypothetical protein BHM03_00023466 [Ensete ventricosum]|nr:hypothetical protein BHM03_00023466 [Ensete ventricosum]